MSPNFILRLLVLSLFVIQPLYASAPVFPTPKPLSVRIKPEGMNTYEIASLVKIKSMIEENLTYWATFPVELPESIFQAGTQIIEIGDIYKNPSDNEMEKLGHDAQGNRFRLNTEQLASIHKEALIVIPSVDYPGMNHVWKASIYLQKGTDAINLSFNEDSAHGLKNLIINVPERFYGSSDTKDFDFSVKKGFRNIYQGLRETVGLAIGLIERVPKYSDADVASMIELDQRIHSVYAARAALDSSYYQIYDELIMEKALPIIAKIKNENPTIEENSYAIEIQARKDNPDVGEDEIGNLQIRASNARLVRGLLKLQDKLDAINPGLTQAILDHIKTINIIYAGEQVISQKEKARMEELREQIVNANPKRGRIEEWVNQKVVDTINAERAASLATRYDSIIATLQAEGLNASAEILKANIDFLIHKEPGVKADLEKQSEPAAEFVYNFRMWNPKNWKIGLATNSLGETSYTVKGEPAYSLQKYEQARVVTNIPFWRLWDAWNTGRTVLNNGLYHILVSNFYSGPLGIKSLTGVEPFYADQTLDYQAGMLVPSRLTQTLASRTTNLWTSIADARKEFDATPSRGFFGKTVTRPLHDAYQFGFRGAVGTSLLWVGQPILTLANAAITAGVTATSLVWAPMTSFAMMGFNFAIYDTKNPYSRHSYRINRILPVVSALLVKTGIKGIGQTAGAIAGSFYYSAGGVGRIGGAYIRSGLRKSWDNAIRNILFRPFGNVPVADDKFTTRIAGPGLSSDYYFQLSPEISILGLRAILEKSQLEIFQKTTQEKIYEPLNKFNSFMKNVFGTVVAMDASRTYAMYSDLTDSTGAATKELYEAVQKREKFYGQLLNSEGKQGVIRQNASDLEQTLSVGQAVVQDFYTKTVFPNLEASQIAEFWREHSLAANQWDKLTKILLAQTFSEGFLTPLEENDKSFRFVVRDDALQDLLESYKGKIGNFSKVTVEDKAPAPAKTWRPRELRLNSTNVVPVLSIPATCEKVFKNPDAWGTRL